MTQDPATSLSPIKSSENEPAASSSPRSAADTAAVEPHYNPHLALTAPPKENTFSEKLKGAGSWMKDYGTALKHGSIKPYPLTERKTRAATRNQAWGPVGQELNELAALSHHPNDNAIIFRVLELRLDYPPEKWRNVYKALSVTEFLVKRGSDDAVVRAKGFINKLEFLESFAYITPDSRDVGGNVRHRARAIRALLQDEKRLKEERHAAAKQQSRMAGGSGGQNEQGRFGGGADGDKKNNLNSNFNKNEGVNSTIDSSKKEPISSSAPGTSTNGFTTTHGTTATSLPNAGETKGVSPEANARHLTALKKILSRPENALCADCGVPGAGHRPTWASISLGVFMCMRCAGVHRGLGVHISQVRSCSLDSWLASQVEFMASCGGNLRANSYWEARLPEGKKPPVTTLADLDSFLRRKYTDKEFVDLDGTWPPTSEEVEYTIMDAEMKRILEEMLPENEREAAVAAREAAEAAAAVAAAEKKLEKDKEEAARKAAQEEQARIETAKAAESRVDLINLLDLDLGDTNNTGALVNQPAVVNNNSNFTNGTGAATAAVDPFGALESIFIAPSSTSAEDKNSTDTAKDPLYASQPPATIDAWDMGAVLAAQQAKQAEEEAERVRKAAQEAAAAAAAEAAAKQQAAYRPPWAPSVSPSSGNTGPAGASPSLPGGFSVPALLTAGPGAAFQDGFSAVPHQFTSTPVVPQGHVAHQYGWAQSQPPAPSPTNKNTNRIATTTAVASAAPQRPLQPHELRAQQLMLNGLDSFNAHASLVAVKQQPSPSMSASGMGAPSPGSIGGVSPPLKSFVKSPSPSPRQ